jgi:hypothetical protein
MQVQLLLAQAVITLVAVVVENMTRHQQVQAVQVVAVRQVVILLVWLELITQAVVAVRLVPLMV